MEPTETNQPQHDHGAPNSLVLLEEAQYYLQKAGQWARFLGIMGFIGSGLMAILSFFIGSIMGGLAMRQGNIYPAGMGGIMGFFYLLIAVLYFFVSLYLYQFGTNAKAGLAFNDPIQVSKSLEKLKSFFKTLGITTIVMMALYVLIIIGVIVGISIGSSMMR